MSRRDDICRALLRAVGLPADETHLDAVVSDIIEASCGLPPLERTPGAIETSLSSIRKKSRYLRAQIVALDAETQKSVNLAYHATDEARYDAFESNDTDRLFALRDARWNLPRELLAIPATIAALEQLETAVEILERYAARVAAEPPDPKKRRTKPRDHAKREVALHVAWYLKHVTEKNPVLWPDDAPAEPWKRGESTEPFAVALREIFEILGFKPGIQAAGEYATSNL